jgi:uncharacterized protein (TIGR02118 family)
MNETTLSAFTNERSSVIFGSVVKVVALIKRKDGTTREEFLEHWSTRHAEIVGELPGLRRYVQNHALEHRNVWPFDGAAELWFDSVGDVARAFADPAADRMRADEPGFISSIEWFLASEHEVPLLPGN